MRPSEVTLVCLDKCQGVGNFLSYAVGNSIGSSLGIKNNGFVVIRVAVDDCRVGDDDRRSRVQVDGGAEGTAKFAVGI